LTFSSEVRSPPEEGEPAYRLPAACLPVGRVGRRLRQRLVIFPPKEDSCLPPAYRQTGQAGASGGDFCLLSFDF